MSAQKRRNMLLGFGGVAIVLVLAIGYLSPNFPYRSEDASGAIGAVEKHRAPQIAQSDVVLGDEQTKQEQQILYADFLADAAALQNFAADLGSEDLAIGVRAASVGTRLAARQDDLSVRYRAAASDLLASLEQLGAVEQLGSAAFQDLQARTSQQLAARNMHLLSARFSEVVEQLAATPCCASALKLQNVQDFESSLASADALSLDAAFNVDRLRSAFEADSLGNRIRAHAAYIDMMASEVMTLDAVSRGIQARGLDAKMLGRFSADLMRAAQELEGRARLNMEASLLSDSVTLEAMSGIQRRLNVASNTLDASSRNALNAFSEELGSRSRNYQNRAQFAMRGQLAAVQEHLAARDELGKRAHLASAMGESNLAAFAEGLASRVR